MDDIQIFTKNEAVILKIKMISQDIGMEFGIANNGKEENKNN